MVIWGGYNGSYLSDGSRYNPASDSWAPTSSSGLAARNSQLAAWSGSEMILWGGYDNGGHRKRQGSGLEHIGRIVPESPQGRNFLLTLLQSPL